MTFRHTKESAALVNKHELERYQLRMADNPDMMAEYQLEQKIKQENNMMIAQHYKEAKAHPETPDMDAKWDSFAKPKEIISMDDYIAQQKTEEQKIEDELRSAVERKREKSDFEKLEERERMRKEIREEMERYKSDPDFDR